MKLENLKPNKKNPRKINSKQLNALRRSLEKFGDLGGIIFNETTGNIVGGHQRRVALKEGKIEITTKYDNPSPTGTVALGYAIIAGERYAYRQVRWDEKKETEALLAANKHSGDWDEDILGLIKIDFPDLDWEIAGFDMPKMDDSFSQETIEKPLNQSAYTDLPAENDDDERYLRENPGPEIQVGKENIGGPQAQEPNPYDAINEKQEVKDKRFLVIISCDSEEHKASVKEKIGLLVKEAGGKFF